jgi:ATP-binding cassette subfamily F protein 3
MIRLTNINKIYLGEDLLKDISWHMRPGEKIGLIGANGTGKTTQLRIICKHEEPDSGEVYIAPGINIGYLSQEPIVNIENTLDEELYSVFKDVLLTEKEIKRLQQEISTLEPGKELNDKLAEIARHQEYFDLNEGYTIDSRIGQVISGLGFNENDRYRAVSTFSGGWQMRISIAKLLLESPDLLLLDEPTNHLDIHAIEWLENYLSNYKGGFIIVSHDREFLDKTVTRIIEMEGAYVNLYWGNYSSYVEQKEAQYEAQLAAYQQQKRKIAHDKVFIEKFRASATRSSQAKSREKLLEKMELVEPPRRMKELKFAFPDSIKSAEEVLKINHLYKAYDDKVIFEDLSLTITRKDKIGLIGGNGSGKTTLLRIIMDLDKEYKGRIVPGQLVKSIYFNQHEARSLAGTATVFDELHNSAPSCTNEQIRTTLGKFGITGDNVFKTLNNLSGGEKARLALSKMLMAGANFLIFDEPTNHLDINAKEALEQALNDFDGTIIVVTHDRKLIDNFANKIFEIENKGITIYPGNYSFYRHMKNKKTSLFFTDQHPIEPKKQDKSSLAEPVVKSKMKKVSPKSIEKEATRVEKDIIATEDQIGQLEEKLANPEFYQNAPDEFVACSEKLEKTKLELTRLNQNWEELVDLLEKTSKN